MSTPTRKHTSYAQHVVPPDVVFPVVFLHYGKCVSRSNVSICFVITARTRLYSKGVGGPTDTGSVYFLTRVRRRVRNTILVSAVGVTKKKKTEGWSASTFLGATVS